MVGNARNNFYRTELEIGRPLPINEIPRADEYSAEEARDKARAVGSVLCFVGSQAGLIIQGFYELFMLDLFNVHYVLE